MLNQLYLNFLKFNILLFEGGKWGKEKEYYIINLLFRKKKRTGRMESPWTHVGKIREGVLLGEGDSYEFHLGHMSEMPIKHRAGI